MPLGRLAHYLLATARPVAGAEAVTHIKLNDVPESNCFLSNCHSRYCKVKGWHYRSFAEFKHNELVIQFLLHWQVPKSSTRVVSGWLSLPIDKT